MDQESRRKGPRSPSDDSDDSSHRRRSRKYDRSPSPRRSRYRRSRSRDRRSGSRDRRRKESSRSQDWKQQAPQPPQTQAPSTNPPATGYVPAVHNQYQAPPPPNTSQPPPPIPAYNPGYNNYNYNYSQGYDYSYQQPPTGYRSDYPPPNWPPGQVPYNNQQAPPLPPMPQQDTGRNVEPVPTGLPIAAARPEDAKKEAIAAEAKQQKATLAKQREEYVKKSTTLQRELEILRQQCDEIGKEGGRENNRIVKENQKLQIEIQNKMKTIHNVIDMLTGIIGDKVTVDDLRSKYKADTALKNAKSPKEEFPIGKSESPSKSSNSDSDKDGKVERDKRSIEDAKPMYNFVHYDPEMHWCKVCDIFPKTAKEYLNHLHSNEHKEACLERKIVDMPWHERNGEGTEKEVPYYPGLPTKRTPIKGLQFFSAATSWYCKLCDFWIGDLHCASLHLKSKKHSENFSCFVDQNPHWETDWMADREKAFSEEKRKQMQLELQKQKEDEPPQPPPPTKSKKSKKSKKNKKKSKKRKNRSSGSDSTSETENTDTDSDQDMSRSIRVAMRNKMKPSIQAILNEDIDYHGIKLKGNWGQVSQSKRPATPEIPPPENDDRQLLNSIRDKLKAKQEEEMKNSNSRRQSIDKKQGSPLPMPKEETKSAANKKLTESLEAWGPKEPPKSFWIKKDEEKPQTADKQSPTGKSIEAPKSEELPKPHMGFWTKQQVNMAVVKPQETKAPATPEKDDESRDRSERSERYKEDRKYDRREDKYERSDRYERRRTGRDRDRDRDRERERDRDRDNDYYDDRRKSRYSNDSPRRERAEKNWRESPKRSYEKYTGSKDTRRDDNNSSNDESKFEKKTNESATKLKKGSGSQAKKPVIPATKGKLPFIGRLPLFKKKNEEPKLSEKADIAPLPYQQSKFEDTPKVPSEIINPPGVVHITKLATPVNLNNSIPVKVVPAPMKILVAPPPPILRNDVKVPSQTVLTTPQVVDMEIEDQSEETLIEEPVVEQQKPRPTPLPKLPALPAHPPPALGRPAFPTVPVQPQPQQQALPPPPPPTPQLPSQPIFPANRPPPFIATAPPPFVPAAARFATRPPNLSPYVATHDDASALAAAAASYAHAHGNPPPVSVAMVDHAAPDISEIPEPAEKRPDPSIPLPDDLQEALNIIFPKEETPEEKPARPVPLMTDTNVMYASMYSMLGCVGYGPEYMDPPPPEITQAETEVETQPGPDDLRMLGIYEGDTIF